MTNFFYTQLNQGLAEDAYKKQKTAFLSRFKEKSADSQQKASKLQNVLNTSYREEQALIASLTQRIVNSIGQGVIDTNSPFQVKDSSQIIAAKKAFDDKYKEYKTQRDLSYKEIMSLPDVSKAYNFWMASYGKRSNLQGQLFESFLKVISSAINIEKENLTEETINQIIKNIEMGKVNLSTEGTMKQEITFSTNGIKETFKSQGKRDVMISHPELGDLPISAKNYSKLRDLSIVSKARVQGAISAWDATNEEEKNAYLHYLIEKKTNYDILGIQALEGYPSAQAEYLVAIFRNRKNNPFMVVSIADIISKNIEKLEDMFNFKFAPNIPKHIKNVADYYKTIKEFTFSCSLKASSFKNYLS